MTLLGDLCDLCDDTLTRLEPGPGHAMIAAVRGKLATPLTVTIAGGVSSGKSTLVNALLGQRVAAVDAGECTRVVTEFRYDAHERAEVHGSDGTTTTLPLERGRMPGHLGRPVEQVARVVVHLSNARLRDLAIVDTPGLNTVTESNEEATAAFLGVVGKEGADTAAAVGRADALVFLLPYLRKADADVLKGFAKLFAGSGLSSVSTVAVLSKIDRLTRDDDPLKVARPMADRIAEDLRGVVAGVVPIIGLLAETAQAAVFTEDDARSLLAVAAIDDELDREDMLLSPEDFLRFDGPAVDEAARRRLLALLDVYGIKVAVAAIDGGARSASGILRALDERSGLDALRDVIFGRFAAQAHLLKAHAAMSDLRRASYLRTDEVNGRVLRSLRSPLERIELDPAMRRLRVLDVAHAVSTGAVRVAPALVEDLHVLADPGATVSREVAADGSRRWALWGNDPRRSPDEARWAQLVQEAFEGAWAR